jgi:tRNA (cmo5U34)-methyltransferase
MRASVGRSASGIYDLSRNESSRALERPAALPWRTTPRTIRIEDARRPLSSCETASIVNRPRSTQFHFDPATYLRTIRTEVPAYDELQDAVAVATAGIRAERVLELGVGTGETSRRVLDLHPEAELVGIDESAEMLAAASTDLAAADLRVSRLEDVTTSTAQVRRTSSLAVAARLRPGGRFVLGDVVVPDDPADVVTPIDGVYDQPSTVDDQVRWLGFNAELVWARQDLCVIVADRLWAEAVRGPGMAGEGYAFRSL